MVRWWLRDVGGGRLTADGAFAATDAFFGPGRSVEFVATFAAVRHQHAGFGNDFNTAFLFAIFSTGPDGASLKARATNGGPETVVDLGTAFFGSPHRYRIDWNPTNVVFSIDGTTVATLAVTIGSNMRPAVSDLDVGGPALPIDWMRLSPYAPSGSFISRVSDEGQIVNWATAAWTSTEPAGTTVALLVRTGNTPAPDGTWSPFAPVTNGGPIGASSRYIQYRADLATGDLALSPFLADVTLACSTCDPTPPAAVADLAASQVLEGNGGDGTTAITITFTQPADATLVEVYRAPFGNYPEYDDGPTPGSPPPVPTYPPGPPWVLTPITTSSQADDPGTRDFWYYSLFSRDACNLVSAVSNVTGGTLNYHLGDVTDGGLRDKATTRSTSWTSRPSAVPTASRSTTTPTMTPITSMWDPRRMVWSAGGRSRTTKLISKTWSSPPSTSGRCRRGQWPASPSPGIVRIIQAAADPRAQRRADSGWVLVRLLIAGGGEATKAIHARIAYDAAALTLIAVEPGDLLQGPSPSFFRHLDEGGAAGVHAVVIGHGLTFTGDGEVARLRFRGHGAASLTLADLRDRDNRLLGDPPATTGINPALVPVPMVVELLPARPNPFNPSTLIPYRLPAAGVVSLRIYDVAGHLVRKLADGPVAAGEHHAVWDGRRDSGRPVASGLYVVQLIAGGREHTQKIQLFK